MDIIKSKLARVPAKSRRSDYRVVLRLTYGQLQAMGYIASKCGELEIELRRLTAEGPAFASPAPTDKRQSISVSTDTNGQSRNADIIPPKFREEREY